MYGYLTHHGIKGQRWGIRRFQNADGSLTAEGRKRYGYTISAPKKDISKLSDSKKLKLAKKQYTKDLRKANQKSDYILEDLSRLRENDDLKEWGDNKEFKADMKKAYQKYVDYEKKGGYGPDYQDELLAPLYKKYPKAKDVLDGMSFWEASSKDPDKVFNEKESTWFDKDPSEFIYYNWIRDLWNNDYYYDYNEDDYNKSRNIGKSAFNEMTKEYAKIYGQDTVDKMFSEKPSEKSKKAGKKVAKYALAAIGPIAVASVIGGGALIYNSKNNSGAPSNDDIAKRIKESLED